MYNGIQYILVDSMLFFGSFVVLSILAVLCCQGCFENAWSVWFVFVCQVELLQGGLCVRLHRKLFLS